MFNATRAVRLPEKKEGGQALVEFALIALVLLAIIFIIVEAALLFQANLTVQNAARAAGRYAITGQFDESCLTETPPCEDPKVASIRAVAEEAMSGLRLNPNALFEEPGFYLIEIFGTDATGQLVENSAGMPGRPIIIRISYRAPILTPLFHPIAETVLVTGQTVMNNEKVVQANTAGDTSAPGVPNPPPVEPTPLPPPDLVLTKSGPPSVNQDTQFSYNLTITNDGQSDATGVVLTDELPTGVTYVSSNPACDESSLPILTCNVGTIPVGDTVTYDIVVEAGAPTPEDDPIVNAANVALDQTDSNPSDNIDTTETHIVVTTTETDLSITKTGPDRRPVSIEGGTSYFVDYIVIVTNNGPNEATDIVVTDVLQGGQIFNGPGSSSDCANPSADEITVVCVINTLSVGGSATLTISARTPYETGLVPNTVEITSANPSNNNGKSDDHETEFVEMADLAITKSASHNERYTGETLNYYIDVTNLGSSSHTATGVNIYDALPDNIELLSATWTGPNASSGSCTISGNAVTCRVGDLQPGEVASAVIEVRALRGGTMINTAQATAEEVDPDINNNIASAITEVFAEADLSIQKTAEYSEPLLVGDELTYRLTVVNSGPSWVTGVRVVDELPEEVLFVYVNSSTGSCEWIPEIPQVVCSLGTMEVGQVETIEIGTIPAVSGQEIVNRAEVRGFEYDPTSPNDSVVSRTAGPGDPFIRLLPQCTRNGQQVLIEGSSWARNSNITLTRIGEDGTTVTIASVRTNNSGFFSTNYTISVPDGTKERFTIRAFKPQQGNTAAQEDTEFLNVPCPNPDLEVTSIDSSALTAEQHAAVAFDVTIENTGNRAVTQQFYVGLYAFDEEPTGDPPPMNNANLVAMVAVSSLDAGEDMTLPIVVSNGLTEIGTNYIYAKIDSTNKVTEMYEDNNVSGALDIEIIASSEPGPTPPPDGPNFVTGETYIWVGTGTSGEYVLQPRVQVTIYGVSEIDGVPEPWSVTGFSDSLGEYAFDNIPDAELTIEGRFVLDGITYIGSVTASPPPPDQTDYIFKSVYLHAVEEE